MKYKAITLHIERLYDKLEKQDFLDMLDSWVEENIYKPQMKDLGLIEMFYKNVIRKNIDNFKKIIDL